MAGDSRSRHQFVVSNDAEGVIRCCTHCGLSHQMETYQDRQTNKPGRVWKLILARLCTFPLRKYWAFLGSVSSQEPRSLFQKGVFQHHHVSMMSENVTLSLMRPLNTRWWALRVLQKASERRLSNAERFASQREMYKVELRREGKWGFRWTMSWRKRKRWPVSISPFYPEQSP